jgi:hypothetical protein
MMKMEGILGFPVVTQDARITFASTTTPFTSAFPASQLLIVAAAVPRSTTEKVALMNVTAAYILFVLIVYPSSTGAGNANSASTPASDVGQSSRPTRS